MLAYRQHVVIMLENDEAHKYHWVTELSEVDKIIREYQGIDKTETVWEGWALKKM